MRVWMLVTLFVLAVGSAALHADDLGAVKETAVRQYDQGNYEESRTTLRQLGDAGALDGPLYYRLFFCEKATGHDDEAQKALNRALTELEKTIPAARSLEDSFYLANTYANLGRMEDARKAALDATAQIDSGRGQAPKTAIGFFQLGKLYQDQGRQTEASHAYAKALDAFDLKGGRYAGNARWALRYLGSGAYARGDFAAAESSFSRLTALGGADPGDWDSLAASRIKLGQYAKASEAWRSLVKLDPSGADDPRYSARLADTAATLAPLPASAKGGAAFTAMSRADLEAFLKTRADAVTAAQARAAAALPADIDNASKPPPDPKLRDELVLSLRETRGQFVAACLEYAIRRYGIRETAFREGYAVLIFQDRAWELPEGFIQAAGGKPAGGS